MSVRLTKDDILYLQRTCAVCGYYKGPLDGAWSSKVAAAEEKLATVAGELKKLGVFDARSEKNIGSLMPPAQEAARRFMSAAAGFGLTVRIISGTRTYAEQEAIYAIGRTIQLNRKPVTNAKAGKSNHNFGIAWDIGLFDAAGRYLDGKQKSDDAAYRELGSYIKARVTGIEWGGDWKSFVDLPHYQLPTGKSVDQIRTRFEAGKPLMA